MQKILLVDDDDIFRERLGRAMQTRGYVVQSAPDAATASRMIDGFQPDAAVLDLKMPGADGLECLRAIKAKMATLRVLILTGYGSIATAMEAVREGAWDYLTKPADADQILAALSRDVHARAEPTTLDAPTLERVEWEHIQRVLSDCGGNISKAAITLGMHRRSLQRKLQKYPPSK